MPDLHQLMETSIGSTGSLVSQIDKLLTGLGQQADLTKMATTSWPEVTSSFFNPGFCPVLDQLVASLANCQTFFDQVVTKINQNYLKMTGKKSTGPEGKPVAALRCEYKDHLGYHFIITKNRLDELIKRGLSKIQVELPFQETDQTEKPNKVSKSQAKKITPKSPSGEKQTISEEKQTISEEKQTISEEKRPVILEVNLRELERSANKQGSIITLSGAQIRHFSIRLSEAQKNLSTEIVKQFKQFIFQLVNQSATLFDRIARTVAYYDLYSSMSKASLLLNYHSPTLVDGPAGSLKCTGIRHPIIERLPSKERYVTIDVDFTDQPGMILFGVNCSGKSSLMKAIGMNLVLAQMGMYVACQQFEFSPYHRILTRIIGSDNLYKALSSYAVEISELRGILKRADEHSLVLCDELSKGSETVSGTALVAATVVNLAQKGATFLSASHLHDLAEIDEVRALSTVRFCHLKVRIDPNTGEITYDRQLTEGVGSTIYGLEIAQALGLDRSTLETAFTIRNRLLDKPASDLTLKQSRYNRGLFFDHCGVPNCGRPAVDTHHIRFQSEASKENGYIDHVHKNHLSNLIPLCKECHDQIHRGTKKIKGFVLTSQGFKLDWGDESAGLSDGVPCKQLLDQ